MKRWRPPRPVILIALLLLAGAVVNVAVAWVLVGAPDSWTPGGYSEATEVSKALPAIAETAPELEDFRVERDRIAEWLRSICAHLGTPAGDPIPKLGSVIQGWGWTKTSAIWIRADGTFLRNRNRLDAGWPARSLTARGAMTTQGQEWASPTFKPPARLLPGPDWFGGYCGRKHIPLTPIPLGFALNTIFYAAILALPLSFFPIRRRLRARRGRCSNCGYDLAGLADPAAPCPECGAAR